MTDQMAGLTIRDDHHVGERSAECARRAYRALHGSVRCRDGASRAWCGRIWVSPPWTPVTNVGRTENRYLGGQNASSLNVDCAIPGGHSVGG